MKKKSLLMMLLAFLFVGTTAWADVDWDQYAASDVTAVTVGKTYVIRSCSNKNFYLRMNPGFNWVCNNGDNPRTDKPESYQWKLEDLGDGTYALKNATENKYVTSEMDGNGYGPASSTSSTDAAKFIVTYNSELSAFTIKHSTKGYLNFLGSYYINFSTTDPTGANASTLWSLHELKESVTYVPTKRASSLVAGRNYMIFNASVTDYGNHDLFGVMKNSYGVNGVKWESARPSEYSSTSKNCLWQVEPNDDGSFKLISVATGKQVNAEGNEDDENVQIVNYANNPLKCWNGVSAWLEDEVIKIQSHSITEENLLWAIFNEDKTKGWNGNASGFAVGTDAFEPFAFYEVKSYTTEQFELEENVEAALANAGKVGYPKATEANNALQTALENAYNADHAAADYWTNLESAYNNYASITDVNLPENGKAYNIYAVFPDGSRQAMYWNGERISTSSSTADPFVCRVTDNSKFVLVNNNGGYLSWFSDGKGYKQKVGVTDEYAIVDGKAYNDLTLTRATADKVSGSVLAETTNVALFGRLHIQGINTDGNTWYLAARDDGEFIAGNASDKWYDLDTWDNANKKYRTVTFTFEEVDYPNTPELNEATIDNDAMTLGTFSAPFATLIPEGVKAFYVAATTGETATLTRINAEAIPANTGVILTAETKTASALMVPATTETVATVSDNMLVATSNADFTPGENVYVLGAKDGVVAFYKGATSNTTLGKNKAYLQLSEGAAPALIMSFGNGEATGIEGVEAAPAAQEGAIFDLSGRRVLNPTKGLYIIGGKKVYIK